MLKKIIYDFEEIVTVGYSLKTQNNLKENEIPFANVGKRRLHYLLIVQ